jgi:type II secretory pathway pseudopilin PulG
MNRHPSKRTFLLLELLIALSLTAILLAVLFRFFAGSVQMDRKVEEARASLYERQHFQTRASNIFSSIVPRSALPPSSGSSFHTLDEKTPGIVAIFDNGIDPDPAFSGPILGKVFLDADDNLALALWPLEKTDKNHYRKEILLSHVQKMRFQFLAKKTFQQPDSKAIPINGSLEWRTNWPKNRWDIPSIIRLIVEQNEREIAFAFSLPFIEPIVTYHEMGGNG